jgi:small subunit ribosomal protein S16
MGTTKRPVYRLVVADSRSPRDGRFIESIGFYDPLPNPAVVTIDTERVQLWLRRGARPSDSARQLLVKEGILAARPFKITPRVEAAEPAKPAANGAAAKAEAAVEERATEAAVEAPAADEAVAEEAVAEEAVAEEAVAEEPVAEAPVAEGPLADEPVAEAAVAEEPAGEAPAAEEPAAEKPVAEEPLAEEPVADAEPSAAAEEPAE